MSQVAAAGANTAGTQLQGCWLKQPAATAQSSEDNRRKVRLVKHKAVDVVAVAGTDEAQQSQAQQQLTVHKHTKALCICPCGTQHSLCRQCLHAGS
jgi:hypothetical protein